MLALGVALLVTVPVQALSAVPPQPILRSSPLLITQYQRTQLGAQLKYVEFYNSGSELIQLGGWSLTSGSTVLTTLPNGYLEPGGYIVLSQGSAVTGASIIATPLPPIVADTLALVPPAGSGFLATEYALKSTGTDGTIWTRTTTQTGYSSSTTSFVADARGPYDSGTYTPPSAPPVRIVEIYPYASDCSPFDVSVLCGDYVKLYNPQARAVTLGDSVLRTDSSSASRTTSNTISLAGVTIAAGGYYTVWLTDSDQRLSLTNSGGYVWLEDTWGLERFSATLARYDSAGAGQQGYAWALGSNGKWQWTSTPRPTSANVITVPTLGSSSSALGPCPAGKFRNPATNRCKNIASASSSLVPCQAGQTRNPATNRCRSTSSAAASLVPCKVGQERNPATNRCRSTSASTSSLVPCKSGYERNPATNRCRKVASAAIPNAEFAVEPTSDSAGTHIGWLTLGVIVALGIGYGIWEWRREIIQRMKRMMHRTPRA